MADDERTTITLLESMASYLRAAVEAGEYASANEAADDAVQLWADRRRMREPTVERLRHAWDVGKASGTYGPIDFDLLRTEARERLNVARTAHGHAD